MPWVYVRRTKVALFNPHNGLCISASEGEHEDVPPSICRCYITFSHIVFSARHEHYACPRPLSVAEYCIPQIHINGAHTFLLSPPLSPTHIRGRLQRTASHPKMMQYASQGVRNAARKGSNALVHHTGYNGPGGGTAANSTSRSIHISGHAWGAARGVPHPPSATINTLEAIRPRNPPHKLFSTTKNFLQRFYTHLTTPGFRTPTHLTQTLQFGARSLHNTPLRGNTIKSSLPLPAREALRNNALHRQANTFLPRGPNPAPPRFGGVAQVGLGTARNFSTGRPIFQHLAENVPVAARALYEVDWDVEMRKEQARMRRGAHGAAKVIPKSQEMFKPVEKAPKLKSSEKRSTVSFTEEIEHYFPTIEVAPVTTYLLIPLAPTPTARLPLPLDPMSTPALGFMEPTLLPPLSELVSLHASHSTHALKVSTIFSRLDQANVWSRGGVHCSAYSQGPSYHRQASKDEGAETAEEGVCTILKVEFVGWTKAEVRGIIGESGSGWCVLEEVRHEEEDEGMSDMDSVYSGAFDDQIMFTGGFNSPSPELIDPSQSFVLPTLDFSASFVSSATSSPSCRSSSESIFASLPSEFEDDPWVEDYPYSSSSGSSSSSDLSSYSIVEPPSTNGWFGQGHGLGPGVGFSSHFANANLNADEPREGMFY